MTALSQGRRYVQTIGSKGSLEVKANTTIYQGALIMLDGANAVPATTATGKTIIGIATATAKSGEVVEFEVGVFDFENSSGADAITKAQIGSDCYVVDDQTVAKTNGTNTRSVAGKVFDVTDGKVLIKVGV